MTSTPIKETQYSRIQVRRDMKAVWDNAPTVKLFEGEIGLEADTGKFKIGQKDDGGDLKQWAELPYWDKNGGKVLMDVDQPDVDDYEVGQLWFAMEANELRILLLDEGDNKIWSVVSIPFSDGRQELGVDAIEERLERTEEALMQIQETLIDGVWIVANEVNGNGDFVFLDAGENKSSKLEDITELRFALVDKNGIKFEFSNIIVGCYIRLGYTLKVDESSGAIFEFEELISSSKAYARIKVKYVRSDQPGVPSVSTKLGVSVMGGGGTGTDVTKVLKTGDTMTGALTIGKSPIYETDNLFTVTDDNQQVFSVDDKGRAISGIKIDGNVLVRKSDADKDYGTSADVDDLKKDVEDLQQEKLNRAGDTMTGTMIIKPDTGKYGLTVYPGPESVGTAADIITARNYDGRQIFYADENGDVGVDPTWSPTKDQHLTNKQYVDQAVAEAVKAVTAGPANLCWIYDKEESTRSLADVDDQTTYETPRTPEKGHFYKKGDYLRFSWITHNEVDLSFNTMKDTQSITADGGPYGTIWHLMENGTHKGKWQMVLQFRVKNFRINAYDNHMEFGLSSTHGGTWNHLAGLDEPYYVNIAGFF